MRIVIVEDQTMLRELLVMACKEDHPGAAVHSAADGASALVECRQHKPDLLVLDLVLPDADGLSLLKEIFAAAPAAKVIALSSHLDEFTLHRAVESRVHGIIHKNEQPRQILREAIAAVMNGRQYFSPIVQNLRASLRSDPSAFDKILSTREQEVLRLIGEGLTNEQIARQLDVTVHTAKAHRLKLMAKLEMHSTPQLIRYALEKGFTRIGDRRPPLAK